MAKVLIADKTSGACAEILLAGGLDVDVRTGLTEDELVEIAGDYEGIVVRSATKVTRRVIEAASKLAATIEDARDRCDAFVEVAGRVFHCPVRELELHAQTEGFIGTMTEIVGRAAVHPDMPGRFVKVSFRARTAHHEYEMSGRIVDFRAIRNQE